ncbi:MAG TPA: MFS transporter [Gemmatimonadales bacterium]|nr:MFS transporter [Gemmatimonadales bacterium]
MVLGPAVGGLAYGFAGPGTAYSVSVALLALGWLALARVRHTPVTLPAPTDSVLESLGTGIRFVWGQPVLLGALTLDLFSVFFGGATALLPIFASDILHAGPQGLGVLRAAPSAGAVGLFGLAIIGFGLARSFLLSGALLALAGMVDMVSVVIRSTLLQTITPEHLLGRVSSVNQIFIGSSNELGAFESGVAARFLGTVPSVIVGGTITLVVVAVTAWRVPGLRRLAEIK